MRPRLAQIIQAVEEVYELPPRSLYERTNRGSICQPRQLAIWLARRLTKLSYPEIGIHFRLHHTTIMHADRQADRLIRGNWELRIAGDKELLEAIHRICTTYRWQVLTPEQK